jgi:hypothetical protein
MALRRLSPLFALALLLSTFALAAPQPAYAISSGCATVDAAPLYTGTQRSFSDLVFEAGETVSVTFSNAAAATTVSIRINDVPQDTSALEPGNSVTLDYTFAAGGTFSIQGRSDASPSNPAVNMDFACAAAPVTPSPTPITPEPTPITPEPTPNPGATPAPVMAPVGIGAPADFVLRTIICDTPLYVAPDGDIVPGGAMVTVGQTWFFAPEVDAEFPGWIEGFFGGRDHAWLPTACVI